MPPRRRLHKLMYRVVRDPERMAFIQNLGNLPIADTLLQENVEFVLMRLEF